MDESEWTALAGRGAAEPPLRRRRHGVVFLYFLSLLLLYRTLDVGLAISTRALQMWNFTLELSRVLIDSLSLSLEVPTLYLYVMYSLSQARCLLYYSIIVF